MVDVQQNGFQRDLSKNHITCEDISTSYVSHAHVSPCCSINYGKLQELLNVAEEPLMCNKYCISLPCNKIL